MLRNHKGLTAVEYIVVGAVSIALLGIAVWSMATNANGQGNNVASWISGINAPTSP